MAAVDLLHIDVNKACLADACAAKPIRRRLGRKSSAASSNPEPPPVKPSGLESPLQEAKKRRTVGAPQTCGKEMQVIARHCAGGAEDLATGPLTPSRRLRRKLSIGAETLGQGQRDAADTSEHVVSPQRRVRCNSSVSAVSPPAASRVDMVGDVAAATAAPVAMAGAAEAMTAGRSASTALKRRRESAHGSACERGARARSSAAGACGVNAPAGGVEPPLLRRSARVAARAAGSGKALGS